MSLSSSRSSSGFFLETLGANRSNCFGFDSLTGSDAQVGEGFLVLISRKLSSSATAMARLKDFERLDEVFIPPIEVNILNNFLTYGRTSLCKSDCLLLAYEPLRGTHLTEFASTKAQDGLTCFELVRRRHAVSLPRRTATGDEQGSQVVAREGKCGEERRRLRSHHTLWDDKRFCNRCVNPSELTCQARQN